MIFSIDKTGKGEDWPLVSGTVIGSTASIV
jgi:hypothetical protein